MTVSKTHEERKVKNYLLLALLLLFVISVFAVTIIKLDVAGENLKAAPEDLRIMEKNSKTALNMLAIAVGMFGMAYASVPLYYAFCKVTGFNGTTQEAKILPDKVYDRRIKILFNTDVSPDLDWEFKKLQDSVEVKVGEEKLVYFEAKNVGDKPIVGMASYNVQPDKMGLYFVKLKCFCFEQQVIKPGQKVDFPVSFFIDPEIMNDRNLDDVKEVVLSYTFFKYKDQKIKEANN